MQHVRVVVSYDVIARADDELDRVTRYLAAAQTQGAQPLVTFEHSRGEARGCADHPRRPQCRRPTVAEYERAFRAFRERFPHVRAYAPWNEPNHRTQPTWNTPETAAEFTNVAARLCEGRTIVVGDVLDQADERLARPPTYRATTRWIQRYRAALRVPRDVCGIHNYSDVNRFRTAGTRAVMRALGCRRYWLTETGGIMSAGGWPRDGARQTRATEFLFRLVARHDASARARDRARARPGRRSAFGHDRPGDRSAGGRGAALLGRDRDFRGALPEPGGGGGARRARRILAADADVRAAARRLDGGRRPGVADVRADHPGEPVRHDRRRYATREFGAPLADYMAAYFPKYTGAYSNRKLVEAVAAIAMTDAGVPSPWLDEALRTLNEFVPQWARPRLWARTPGGVIRGAYLSYPVTHPLA